MRDISGHDASSLDCRLLLLHPLVDAAPWMTAAPIALKRRFAPHQLGRGDLMSRCSHEGLTRSFSWIAMLAAAGILSAMLASARADTWRGTAPFCAGHCLSGETQVGVSDSGDGGYCVTGHKVLCRNTQSMCQSRETRTS